MMALQTDPHAHSYWFYRCIASHFKEKVKLECACYSYRLNSEESGQVLKIYNHVLYAPLASSPQYVVRQSTIHSTV